MGLTAVDGRRVHYFYIGKQRELSLLHLLLEIRPISLSEDDHVIVAAACRQCLEQACWGDASAVDLCLSLLARTHSSEPAHALLKLCQENDSVAIEQILLQLQQQVIAELQADCSQNCNR